MFEGMNASSCLDVRLMTALQVLQVLVGSTICTKAPLSGVRTALFDPGGLNLRPLGPGGGPREGRHAGSADALATRVAPRASRTKRVGARRRSPPAGSGAHASDGEGSTNIALTSQYGSSRTGWVA